MQTLARHWAALGPDAMDPDATDALVRLRGSRSPVKARLLDQALIAGVGNIYADEALFRAGVRPTRPGRSLSEREVRAIAEALRTVMASAIEARGSTLRDYRDPEGEPGAFALSHAVYGRGGTPCSRCASTLLVARVAQRTTVWCPRCQA